MKLLPYVIFLNRETLHGLGIMFTGGPGGVSEMRLIRFAPKIIWKDIRPRRNRADC